MPDKLLELAEQAGIIIEYWEFTPPLIAVYTCLKDIPPVIGLDVSLLNNTRFLRCVLAEELGHHFTTTGDAIPRTYFHYARRLYISKIEHKALRWGANYLIPNHELQKALARGLQEVWELADHFDVTEEFMQFRLKLLQQEG